MTVKAASFWRGWESQGGRQWGKSRVASLLGSTANFLPCHFRPEVQDLDGSSQCPGLASGKPEDEEEEEEELEEDDDDSLAGKSQDDTVSPTPEPQGAYEDEDEEPPTSLAVGFDHTRRWVPASPAGVQPGRGQSTPRVTHS